MAKVPKEYRLTFTGAKQELRSLGVQLRKTEAGDYNVRLYVDKGEGYFTDDLKDAYDTGLKMVEDKAALDKFFETATPIERHARTCKQCATVLLEAGSGSQLCDEGKSLEGTIDDPVIEKKDFIITDRECRGTPAEQKAGEAMRKQLHEAATLLQGKGRLLPIAEAHKFKGVAYVEDVGMFILRDSCYGVRDLDMVELQKRYPNKIVYFLGGAETIE